MSPIKFKEVFVVAHRSKLGNPKWRAMAGRFTYMAACEEAEMLRGRFQLHEFKPMHQKLFDKKGELA